MPITYVPKPKSSVEAALSTQASPVPTPTPQDPQEESSYLDKARILAAMGLRIAGPFAGTAAGTILGAETGPGALLTGAAGRGIGSALGEGAAELVEPGGIDRIKQDPAGALKRMGLEGAIGATPLGWWGSKGKMLQSAAKAGAMGVAGTEARRYIAGEPLSPRQWSTGELVGTAASPLMGALLSRFGGHDPAPPPGPFEHTPVDLESTLEHVKNNEPLKGYQEHVLRKQYEKDPGSVKAVLKVRDERLADNTKLNDAVVGRNPAQEKAAVTAAKAETTARKMIDQEAAADIKVKLDAEAEKIKARNQTVREINEGFKANADLDKNEANVKKASDKQWTKEAANLTTAEKKDKEIADVISKHKAAEAEHAANQARINLALAQGLEPGDPVVDVRAKVNTKEGSTNVSQRWRRVVDPEADLEDVPPAQPIGNPRNPKGKGPSGGAAPIAAQPAKPAKGAKAKPSKPANPAPQSAEFDAKTIGMGDNVGRPGEAKPKTTLPVVEPKDAVGPVDPSALSPKGLIQMGYAKDMASADKLYKDLQAAAEFKAEVPPKPTIPPEAPPAAAPAKPKPTKPQGPAGGATAKPKPDPLGGKKPMTEADNAAMAKQLIAATEKKPGVLENELPTDDMIIKKKGGLRVKGPSVNNGKVVTEPKPGAPLDVQGPSQAEGVGKVSLAKEKAPEPKVAAAAAPAGPEPPKPPTAEPDPEWREVNKGEAFPPGREFKMDISTGKNYVKKLPEEMLAHPKPVEPAGPMGPEEPAKGKVVIIRDAQGLYGLERDGEVLPKHSYPTRAEAQAALNKLGKQAPSSCPYCSRS
jgi:hypothetical protein